MDWELDDVARPFVAQLRTMGWCCVEGKPGRLSLNQRGGSQDG